MRLKRRLLSTLLVLGMLDSTTGLSTQYYSVKSGDTLSQIVQKFLGKPIYGKGKNLDKVIALNPNLNDANFIRPGDKVFFGDLILAELTAPTPATQLPTSASTKKDLLAPVAIKVAPTPEEKPVRAPATESVLTTSSSSSSSSSPSSTEEEEELDPEHRLLTGLRYNFRTLNLFDKATGGRASLYSSYSLGTHIGWAQYWSPQFVTLARFSFERLNFEPSTNPSKSLGQTRKNLIGFHLGAGHKWGGKDDERYTFRYELSYDKKLFAHGFDSSTINIDAVPVTGFSTEFLTRFISRKRTSAGAGVTGEVLASSKTDSFRVRTGYSYGAHLYLTQKFGKEKKSNLSLKVGYSERHQNTTILNVIEKNISTQLNYQMPIFEEP